MSAPARVHSRKKTCSSTAPNLQLHSSKPAAAGLLLWARWAWDIDRLLQQRGQRIRVAEHGVVITLLLSMSRGWNVQHSLNSVPRFVSSCPVCVNNSKFVHTNTASRILSNYCWVVTKFCIYGISLIATACTVVHAVSYEQLYKPLVNATGMGNFRPHRSQTIRPILIKLETYNYRPKTTHHAKRHFDPTT